jgi:anti-sigma-K factor RskA
MISPERLEQAAAYALGAMDASEVQAFEAALAQSSELRTEVDEMRRVYGLLGASAPPVPAPAGLRGRILADARKVRPIATAPRETAPPLAADAVGSRSAAWTALPWVLAAAAIAFVAFAQSRLRTEREVLASRAARSDSERDSLRNALAARDSVITLLLAPDVETAKLVATGRPPSARLYWNRARNQVILAAFALPPAPPGRTYQLWGIAGANAKPVSLGLFNTTAAGEGRLTANVPTGLTIAVGAVTEEPQGGSPQPTTTPFLVGQIKAGQ